MKLESSVALKSQRALGLLLRKRKMVGSKLMAWCLDPQRSEDARLDAGAGRGSRQIRVKCDLEKIIREGLCFSWDKLSLRRRLI